MGVQAKIVKIIQQRPSGQKLQKGKKNPTLKQNSTFLSFAISSNITVTKVVLVSAPAELSAEHSGGRSIQIFYFSRSITTAV